MRHEPQVGRERTGDGETHTEKGSGASHGKEGTQNTKEIRGKAF